MANDKPPGKQGERPRRKVVFIDLKREDGAHPTVVDPTLGAEAARRQRRLDESRLPTVVPGDKEGLARPAPQPRRPTVSGVGSPASAPPAKKK